jgi:mono/diheme cytochrome c family protein
MKNVEMKLRAFKILTVVAFITTGTLVSCVGDNNSPGLEYMPDMYRAPSVEGQVDYGEVRGMVDTAALNMVERKFSYLAPQGTIPYTLSGDMFLAPYRHGAPMGIGSSHGLFEVREDSTGLANARLDVNPIAYSEQVAKEGEELYGRFCIHCHGKAGDGQGTVITNSNGKFPPPPAYKKDMPAGEMYYIITYGRNTMGAHGSQVNPVERWKIVYHIDKLVGRAAGQAPATDSLNVIAGLDSLTAAPVLPK